MSIDSPDLHSSSLEYSSRFKGASGSWILEHQSKLLLEVIESDTSENARAVTALDIGGGHGQVTPLLLDNGFDVQTVVSVKNARYLLDVALDKLNSCSINESKFRSNIKFEPKVTVAELTNLPFDDQSFTLVISLRILCHLPNWKDLITEMCRVSKSEVVFDYPSNCSIGYFSSLMFPLKRFIEGNTRYYTVFNDNEIRSVLEEAGFGEIKTIRQFIFPVVLHRALKYKNLSAKLEKIGVFLGLTRRFGSPVLISAKRSKL